MRIRGYTIRHRASFAKDKRRPDNQRTATAGRSLGDGVEPLDDFRRQIQAGMRGGDIRIIAEREDDPQALFLAQRFHDRQHLLLETREQLLQNFQAKVLPIVEDLRKEKGLWIIFALGDNSNIAAAHAGLDLSWEVIKRLDATIK